MYVNYSPEIAARHFAGGYPGAPEELKKSARGEGSKALKFQLGKPQGRKQ